MMETSHAESVKDKNRIALEQAFGELIEQADRIDPQEDTFLLESDTQLTDAIGHVRRAHIQMVGSIVFPTEIVLTFRIRDLDSKELILNFPGNFHKAEDESYIENKAGLTKIRVNDELSKGVGIPTAVLAHVNELRKSIFRRYAKRFGIDRFFINAIDSSNEENTNRPGWTSNRMEELGYTPIGDLTFQKCVYLTERE